MCSSQENLSDFTGPFDMAIVTGVYLGDIPAASASFIGEHLKKWPCGIILSYAGNIGTRNAGLPVGLKKDRLFKAAQAKITKSGTHKLPFLAWY